MYKTPGGLYYPSVTSVLGHGQDKSGLDDWRERVGAEEADRTTRRSATRGTNVHRLCEKYILNEEFDLRKEMPVNVMLFKQIQRQLNSHMDTVRGCESFLYSDSLRLAGACDLIADWDGKPSIIDFKTSANKKDIGYIKGYLMQESLYSAMWHERTGLVYPNLVTIIAVETENEAQVFEENIKDHLLDARKLCQNFHRNFPQLGIAN